MVKNGSLREREKLKLGVGMKKIYNKKKREGGRSLWKRLGIDGNRN